MRVNQVWTRRWTLSKLQGASPQDFMISFHATPNVRRSFQLFPHPKMTAQRNAMVPRNHSVPLPTGIASRVVKLLCWWAEVIAWRLCACKCCARQCVHLLDHPRTRKVVSLLASAWCSCGYRINCWHKNFGMTTTAIPIAETSQLISGYLV